MKPTETLSAPPLQLRAALVPGSWNPATFEVDITFASSQRAVKLDGWGDQFLEELDLSPGAIRLDRINARGPVLDAHGKPENRGGSIPLENQVGVVCSASTNGDLASARIRIANVPSTSELRAKIDQGVVPGVSVGYFVHAYRDITTAEDAQRVLLAVDWEPFEITLLPIPADHTVGLRAANTETRNPCLLEGPETMKPEEKAKAAKAALLKAERERGAQIRSMALEAGERVTAAQMETWIIDGTPVLEVRSAIAALPAPTPPADPTDQPAPTEGGAPFAQERIRSLEIHRLGRTHNLPEQFVDDHLQRGTEVEAFRSLAMDQLATREGALGDTRSANSGAASVGEEEQTKRFRSMQMAIDHRAGVNVEDKTGKLAPVVLDDGGRHYRTLTLLEMGREALDMRGVQTRGLDKKDLALRALSHTTSDFSGILANTANRSLRQAYDSAPSTWRPLAKIGDASDFKAMTRLQLGDAPSLKKVGDSGEVERGSMGEGSESYAVEAYARTISLSRKTIVNDDLQAFTRLTQAFGRSAADLESSIVWGLVTSNVVMGDGVQVFHADHGNLGAGVINVANIGIAMALMAAQRGVPNERGEEQFINASPSFLVVPSILKGLALQFVSATVIPSAPGNVNPYAGTLQVVSDPRLDVSSLAQWYMASSPSELDVIEVSYLDGVQGPTFKQEEGFHTQGLDFQASLDFGAVVLDHRGLFRSSGA